MQRLALVVSLTLLAVLTVTSPAGAVTSPENPGEVASIPAPAQLRQGMNEMRVVPKNDPEADAPLSPGQQDLLARKTAEAKAHAAERRQGAAAPNGRSTAASAEMNWLSVYYFPQIEDYYCGPSTLLSAMYAKGLDWGTVDDPRWSHAADLLDTDFNGNTPWYINPIAQDIKIIASGYNTGRPMADAMNYEMETTFYVPQPIPGTPTLAHQQAYVDALVSDIDNNYLIMGNTAETPTSDHLAGHPTNRNIFHWIGVYGYDAYGDWTMYIDPAGNSAAVPADWNAPSYDGIYSDTLVGIFSSRGYIW
ncbi:hypothetical protein [Nonomuraea candida]|uniref:hypothetical protein n=1 Tax=Nonomuraea candida TaxID=359159 RepID=UPI0012FA36BD|nr:hypothetical protein [Nonomuraea candida]